ncbi:hypothetical protein D6C85_09944 [Aureobasidium pullulans]|uniref:Uncharacterized protein n=1 Tax=Aureobasidium pullulans TaxID=5580 RepID=A0A4S9W6L1_AURPU|nr:hypothetical protein D6C85_09944 [Aureobasidium pullulans]
MRLLFLLSSAAVLATAKPIGNFSTDSVEGPASSPHQLEASATWPRFYTYHDRHDTQYDSAAAIVDDKTLESRNDVAEPEQVLPLELETHSRPMDFCFDDYCCSGSRCGMVPANEHAEFLKARVDDAMYDQDHSLEPRAATRPPERTCWSDLDPLCSGPPAAQIKARETRDTDVKSGTVEWLESRAAARPPRRYCWSDVDPFCSGPPAAQIKAREARDTDFKSGAVEWLESRAAARPPRLICWNDQDPVCTGPPLQGRSVNSQHASKRLSQAKARESVIVSAPVIDSIVAGKTPLLARASRPPGRFCFGHYEWFCRQTAHGEAK